jgi:hypothetical protein
VLCPSLAPASIADRLRGQAVRPALTHGLWVGVSGAEYRTTRIGCLSGSRPSGGGAVARGPLLRTLDHDGTASQSIAAAQRRAGAHPEGRLPCPACAAGLKGTNFERHLREKHPEVDSGTPNVGVEELQLVGIDHRIRRTFAALTFAWFVAVIVLLVTGPVPIGVDGERTPTQVAQTPVVIIVALGLVIGAIIAILRAAGAFRARITVTGNAIRLSHRLGTGRRHVPLPAAVETGTLFIVRSDRSNSGGSSTGLKVRAGAYLRVADGHRSITVGCPHGAGIRKHWNGWTAGPRRKWWDVDLSAPAFVELQYALAAAGLLAPPR